MKYDFHTHSKYSQDGFLDPEKMVRVAIKKGLSGMAVTDHDTLKGALKAKEHQTDDFKVIIGSEVTTNRGEVIGLFLSEEIKAHNFEEVLDEIIDQDGLVVLPHPFDELRGNGVRPGKKDVKRVNFLEVYNSRCLLQSYNQMAKKAARKYGLNSIAGSDAHFAREIGKAGVTTREEDVRNAVLRGNMEIFGEKSNIINLGLTKVLKTWRKRSSG